ncbi:lung seven transmembrane receptor [Babesia ovis]|uniref:Lung seven transmembrane receptor n=1 Tax=Babesia ovis TaxID=5869 RepID=A0A9W5WWH3_BABOV|nr:lung seven transmembrane receptor [Babesia ovis]
MEALLFLWTLAVAGSNALVMELNEQDGPQVDVRIPLCYVPVLGSASEQLYTPRYQFSLVEGGTIAGTIEVASVVEDSVSTLGKRSSELVGSLKDGMLPVNPKTPLRVRRRFITERYHQDHNSWVQLLYNIYRWLFYRDGTEQKDTGLSGINKVSDKQALDNVYILLLSRAKWDLYSSAAYEEYLQPAKGKDRFVLTSHIVADMRIPITKVGQPVEFSFRAKEPDRFVLMLFNADERKLMLKGQIEFVNPGGDHLPTEMKYFAPVVSFWESVYRVTGVLALAYLILHARGKANVVNYIMAVNFLFVGAYLRLDRTLMDSLVETGKFSNILWTFTHMVRRLHENCLMAILLLLALGWKVVRTHLTGMEYRVVLSVATFSAIGGFIEILVFGVDISRSLVHTMAFIAILIATNFNILLIRARVVDESLNAEAGMAYAHLKAYNLFKIGFFAAILKPEVYSIVRSMCLQITGEHSFIWDEHFMLFIDLFFDYIIYCVYFVAFIPIAQLPLFKHLFATRSIAP